MTQSLLFTWALSDLDVERAGDSLSRTHFSSWMLPYDISVSKLADDDLVTLFKGNTCHIHNKLGKTIADSTQKGNGLYYFAGCDPKVVEHVLVSHACPDLATWHCRLGHINYTSII